MGLVELLLIAVGLSADAFAVSVCKGLGMRRINMRHTFIIALFFGGFQALMPVIGWFLGSTFARFVEPIDHWIAFGLLAFIGGKMIYDAINEEEDAPVEKDQKLDMKELVLLAIATSIDALAVGISFSLLNVNIVTSAIIIGITTFILSCIGVAVGNRFGAKFEKGAQITGGVVLIIIGLKILLEHLGFLG
ncbi:MAG: manganese efflux pump [Coriobacteriales bacterium]|nr:manganese efflux pump [Coriobacteriales bacterium]